jgi:outer membrane biosynthesis protein TonB
MMSLAKSRLSGILAILCLLSYGFTAEPQQQVTVLKYVVPVYPAIAKTARIAGDVLLSFNVQSDGTVSDVNYVFGAENAGTDKR